MLFVPFVSNLRALSHSEKLTGPVLGLLPWTPSAKPCSDRPRSYRSLHRLWIHLSIKITLNPGSRHTCAVVYHLLKVVPYAFNPRPSFPNEIPCTHVGQRYRICSCAKGSPPDSELIILRLVTSWDKYPFCGVLQLACSIPLSLRKSC